MSSSAAGRLSEHGCTATHVAGQLGLRSRDLMTWDRLLDLACLAYWTRRTPNLPGGGGRGSRRLPADHVGGPMYLTDKELRDGASQQDQEWGGRYYEDKYIAEPATACDGHGLLTTPTDLTRKEG